MVQILRGDPAGRQEAGDRDVRSGRLMNSKHALDMGSGWLDQALTMPEQRA